jgi:hypothetical protein
VEHLSSAAGVASSAGLAGAGGSYDHSPSSGIYHGRPGRGEAGPWILLQAHSQDRNRPCFPGPGGLLGTSTLLLRQRQCPAQRIEPRRPGRQGSMRLRWPCRFLPGCLMKPGLGPAGGFTSVRGAAFYRLPPNAGQLVLRREDWKVPELLDGCVPLAHGRTLAWSAART